MRAVEKSTFSCLLFAVLVRMLVLSCLRRKTVCQSLTHTVHLKHSQFLSKHISIQRHHQCRFSTALCLDSSNEDTTSLNYTSIGATTTPLNRLESISKLEKAIRELNGGNSINVQSPKQVSQAIFGRAQSATKSILQQAASDPLLNPKQRQLAALILQCRTMVQESKRQPPPPTTSFEELSTTSFDRSSNGVIEATVLGDGLDSEALPTSLTSQRAPPSHEQLVNSLIDRQDSQLDEYWREPLQQLSRPVARELVKQLDPIQCPMAFDPAARGGRRGGATAAPSAGKKGTFLAFCRQQKKLYPQYILLVRMGDFYETFGTDALLMVEHVGLNPMGGKAKAGCPYRSIQATLNGLTTQGFSVAVYEEVGQTASNKLKTRVLSQIVSPASPTYLYDNWLLGDSEHTTLDRLPASRPCVGIVHTSAGYHMMEVSLEERSIEYSERLTPEAVACRLAAYPPADPLVYIPAPTEEETSRSTLPFLQRSERFSMSLSDGTKQNLYESHMGGFRIRTLVLPPHLIPSAELSEGSEIDRNMKAVIDALMQWNERRKETDSEDYTQSRPTLTDFRVSKSSAATNPLYLETASQLGLLNDPSIPSLIAHVLDDAAPLTTRNFLRRYLLVPPPPYVAEAMAEVVQSLMDPATSPALPPLTVPPLGKVLSLIRAGQASANIYGELLQTLSVARFVLQDDNDGTSLPVEALLTLCSHESGLPAEQQSLIQRCQNAMAAIEAIISPIHHVDDGLTGEWDDDLPLQHPHIPQAFLERNEESWRGRVQPTIARDTYRRVEETVKALGEAIRTDFLCGNEGNQSLIAQDIFNNLLVLKKVPPDVPKGNYIHPRDRHGKSMGSRYTTEKVQEALSNYVSACEDARGEVATLLSNLAQTLQNDGHIPAIVQAAQINLVLSVAFHHTVKATKQNWHLAHTIELDSEETTSCRFEGLWPYWMPQTQAVANSFDLNGMFLLTAPNMSGKSTLMRATAAATLLTLCGLCAPLQPGSQIPRFDTLFLRGASADVPAENKSAFGAEMEDIAALMRCCGPSSLVFVDEIGRGTSPRDGTRLAAAILESMACRGMSGVFATHLHGILELPLRSKERIHMKQMAIDASADDSYEWTYQLDDGVCKDSLAMVTASRFGLPDEIISRANELDDFLCENGNPVRKLSGAFAAEETARNDDSSVHTPPPEVEPRIAQENRDAAEKSFRAVVDMAETLSEQSATIIPPRCSPPPALANKSCVYVLQLQTDPPRYYVGESDSFFQRLNTHRGKGVEWSKSKAIALALPSKSDARYLESCLIQRMAQAGYSMQSKSDGRRNRRRP